VIFEKNVHGRIFCDLCGGVHSALGQANFVMFKVVSGEDFLIPNIFTA
jgi:hypothetical protein